MPEDPAKPSAQYSDWSSFTTGGKRLRQPASVAVAGTAVRTVVDAPTLVGLPQVPISGLMKQNRKQLLC